MRKLFVLGIILIILPFVFAESTFFDNPDDFFIMDEYVAPTPVVTPSGGGGGRIVECREDRDCDLGEFCFENKCYVYECETDNDCNDTKTCWMNRCLKLFDMKIVDVSSPIYPGEFFEFTYFLKGVAEIHGDVVVNFWIVGGGEVVTEGFDTIYMGDFEERMEATELFLPSETVPGVYNFYAEVNYDSYYARAGRLIEVVELLEEVVAEEIEEVVPITGGVIAQIDERIRENVVSILVIIGIFILALIVYWERRKIGKALAVEEKWLKRYRVSVAASVLLFLLFGTVYYLFNVGSFVGSLLLLLKNYYVYFFLLIAIVLTVFVFGKVKGYCRTSGPGKKFLKYFESLGKKREERVLSVRKEEKKERLLEEREEKEEEKERLVVEKDRVGIMERVSSVFFEFLAAVRKRSSKMWLFLSKNVDGVSRGLGRKAGKWKGAIKKAIKERKAKIERRRIERLRVMSEAREAERIRLEEEDKEKKAMKLREGRELMAKDLVLRKAMRSQRRDKLLRIKNRKIMRDKIRNDILGFFRNVKMRAGGAMTLFSSNIRKRRKVLMVSIRRYEKMRKLRLIEIKKRKRKEELVRLKEVRLKVLMEKRVEAVKKREESVRLKEEAKRRASLGTLKAREKRRGLKLLRLMRNKMMGHRKKLVELERVKGRIEKIEKAESKDRVFLGARWALAWHDFVDSRMRGGRKIFWSLADFLRYRIGRRDVGFVVDKSAVSESEVCLVTNETSVQKPRLEPKPKFKPLVSFLKKDKEPRPKRFMFFPGVKSDGINVESSVFALALEEKLKTESRLAEAKRKERESEDEGAVR